MQRVLTVGVKLCPSHIQSRIRTGLSEIINYGSLLLRPCYSYHWFDLVFIVQSPNMRLHRYVWDFQFHTGGRPVMIEWIFFQFQFHMVSTSNLVTFIHILYKDFFSWGGSVQAHYATLKSPSERPLFCFRMGYGQVRVFGLFMCVCIFSKKKWKPLPNIFVHEK